MLTRVQIQERASTRHRLLTLPKSGDASRRAPDRSNLSTQPTCLYNPQLISQPRGRSVPTSAKALSGQRVPLRPGTNGKPTVVAEQTSEGRLSTQHPNCGKGLRNTYGMENGMKTDMAWTSLAAYEQLVRANKDKTQEARVLKYLIDNPVGKTQWDMVRDLRMLRSAVCRPCNVLVKKQLIFECGARKEHTGAMSKVYYPITEDNRPEPEPTNQLGLF